LQSGARLTGSCEKRGLPATEGKQKSDGVIAGAASVWLPRVERMAKEAQSDCPIVCSIFVASRHDAVAAITSGSSRNHGDHRP
jgi:hypothetical protein